MKLVCIRFILNFLLIIAPSASFAAPVCSQLFPPHSFDILRMRPGYQKSDDKLSVKRFSRAEKAEHQVTVKNGLLYFKGELLDTSTGTAGGDHRRGLQIFALDTNLNLITAEHAPVDFIHHSTLVEGGEGLFFGEWRVKKGKIVMVSNMSGHFRPTVTQLNLFVAYLKNLGVTSDNLDIVEIEESESD